MRLVALYAALLAVLWGVALQFGVTGGYRASDVLACAILLAPFWLFGFGLAERVAWPRGMAARVLLPLGLLAGYVVFALPRGVFRWNMCLGMAAVTLAVSALLASAGDSEPGWRDWAVLAILGISVDLRFFNDAFPLAGLSSMPKLLFVDVGLYGYLVLRPIEGIGYDFRPRWSDGKFGLREFAFYTPVALALGFALSFLHFHRTLSSLPAFAAGWIFTLLFIAVPEELFFRGMMLNMLARRFGTKKALVVSSALFGLAHFNKRAVYFNWRYVILAAIAGLFYGRAWLARRRVLTASVTHATVDTVWSVWLR